MNLKKLQGTWHITEMEMWNADYFNMETQAYIKIDPNGTGKFQFGLVEGYFNGKLYKYLEGERFEFTWEGSDENDAASGSGWVQKTSMGKIEGEFKMHYGDVSTFTAVQKDFEKD